MKLNEMTYEELVALVKKEGLKISTKNKTKEQLVSLISKAKPELVADDDEEEEDDVDDTDELLEVPEWDEDDIASVSLDEVMDLDWFEENILKCDIRKLARLPRNDRGHSRIATRKARVWLCDDCFPSVDEDDPAYKEEARKLKEMAHIVTMTKADPLCARSEWYKKHDGMKAIDSNGNRFKVNYAKEMARVYYFIHVDSFSGEDVVNDMDDLL